MPRIVRWYLRTALVMFVLALIMGVIQNLKGVFPSFPSGLGPVYVHLLTVGWITQFIFGVAIWMLPKFSMEKPRANESLSWAAYFFLNSGLLLRVIGEPLNATSPGVVWGWLLVVSAFIQWLGGTLFVVNAWRRVKEK